jgi:starch synthase (maltosyl-transferring)
MKDPRNALAKSEVSGAAAVGEIPPPPRVIITAVTPEIDGGRFPIKRVRGETVAVGASIFAEAHEQPSAVVRYRQVEAPQWHEVAMRPLGNDRWEGTFVVSEIATYEYTVEAWVDSFTTWCDALARKWDAGQDVSCELQEGAALVRLAATHADDADATWLRERADLLGAATAVAARVAAATAADLQTLMARYPDRSLASRFDHGLRVIVERERARSGAWYEIFPRSCGGPHRHGTFADCVALLPYVAAMGFDVLYLPPIHPIGRTHRKGRNNAPAAAPGDPGSPWAIGGREGGHTAIHPQLGTLADFDDLVARAREHGIEIALDLAFQCSPDHPYVREHPEWFRWRADGTVQYAENPPKKYQDIYPLNFTSPAWRELWNELRRVVLFWMEHGVRIFRVDNPHTKPFAFWEWLIGEIRAVDPTVIFLAEAFTRPQVMRHLAKLGFSQSYGYFTWRNTKWELTDYFTELARTEVRDYMRPNLFVNTPDILHEYLQTGGRPAFYIRLVLAATLGASYGIYGPAFELCEGRALPGTEEYLDSEKYELRQWNLEDPRSLRNVITRVNQIRREQSALHHDHSVRFCAVDNEQLIAYVKSTPDLSNIVLVVVNLDPHHPQMGWVDLPLAELGLDVQQPYQVHDLLSDARYLWHGPHNYVALDPHLQPAHVFCVRRRLRTERDFDYYM